MEQMLLPITLDTGLCLWMGRAPRNSRVMSTSAKIADTICYFENCLLVERPRAGPYSLNCNAVAKVGSLGSSPMQLCDLYLRLLSKQLGCKARHHSLKGLRS